MSLLGGVLDLADGARLTGVTVLPRLEQTPGWQAYTAVHRIRLDVATDPTSIAGALGVLVPSAVVTLQGNEPDGGTWVAVIQLVDVTGDRGWRKFGEAQVRLVEKIAANEVDRALDLLGIGSDRTTSSLSDGDLLTELNLTGAVWGIWSPAEGLLAQVCCLATGMTEEDAVGAGGPGFAREDGIDSPQVAIERAERFARFNRVLRNWAEDYDGPDS